MECTLFGWLREARKLKPKPFWANTLTPQSPFSTLMSSFQRETKQDGLLMRISLKKPNASPKQLFFDWGGPASHQGNLQETKHIAAKTAKKQKTSASPRASSCEARLSIWPKLRLSRPMGNSSIKIWQGVKPGCWLDSWLA